MKFGLQVSESQSSEWHNSQTVRAFARDRLPRMNVVPFHSASRKDHKAGIEKIIKMSRDLDAAYKKEMENLHKKFMGEKQKLEVDLICRQAVISPIRALPREILAHILALYFNTAAVRFGGSEYSLEFSSRLEPLQVC